MRRWLYFKAKSGYTSLCFFFLLCFAIPGFAQKTVVTGKVTDATTGEPIPFANVVFSGTGIGATTNFDGFYTISADHKYDSVTVSYIGFISSKKAIKPFTSQTVNFQLQESVVNLQEVVVRPGKYENPAHPIMRKVIDNKKRNDKLGLNAYEYESYSKIQLDISQMSNRFKKQKLVQKIQSTYDSIQQITSDEGEPLLPIFISESISEYYYRNNPKLTKEKILKTRIKGIGVEDGSLLSQIIGSSFQEYNFNNNWLNILEKEFVSPIADGWKLYYEYDLMDSLYIGEDYCYRIDVYPKQEQDLAFTGTIWITKEDYALKQIDVSVRKTANINFVDKIDIEQQLIKTTAGNWIPEKTRVVINIQQLTPHSTGFIAKFYTSVKNPVVNQPHDPKFYQKPLEVAPDAQRFPADFWDKNRHDSLTTTEIKVIDMIDTVNSIPYVKRTIGLLKALGSGYFEVGKVDIGPYPLFYTFNKVEKHRIGFGLSTNEKFSRKVVLSGLAAYGTGDKRFKYDLSASFILSRNYWTVAKISTTRDIEQVGLDPEELRNSYFFYASSKWGELNRPYLYNKSTLSFQSNLLRDVTAKVSLSTKDFDPLFPFYYRTNPTQFDPPYASTFSTAEVKMEARFAYNETYVFNDNNRISLGTSSWPEITVGYTYGFKDFLGSDFEYRKLSLKATQKVKMAFLGVSRYTIEAGHIIDPLPYPLLKVHVGNESIFYTSVAYNLMNRFEFVSDTYASLRYIHHFEGFLLNRIPLMKKLKWRALAHANVLYGGVSQQNLNLLPTVDAAGNPLPTFNKFTNLPYVEVGYGIENIFRFFRVDAFHRLTYLDNQDVRKFGIKVSAQIIL